MGQATAPAWRSSCDRLGANGDDGARRAGQCVIHKLLGERPANAGITLPGMPEGSPGMTGRKSSPFTIYAVTKDSAPPKVYAIE